MADLCIQLLLQDHRATEKILAQLESLLDLLKASPQRAPEQGKTFTRIRAAFDEVVIAHMRKEEEVFFPALEDFLPPDVGPLAVLRSENADLWIHFHRMCEVAETLFGVRGTPELGEEFERHARKIIQILRDHIYKEDRVLFSLVARFLPASLDALLCQQIGAISPPQPTATSPKPAL